MTQKDDSTSPLGTEESAEAYFRLIGDAKAECERLERENEQLRDGIRALAVKFDRAAVAHRDEGFNGQAELWDMAANKTRALLAEQRLTGTARGGMMSNETTIGKCSNCGGRVVTPRIWAATTEPPIYCKSCGARASHGPTIPMNPPPQKAAT